MYICVCNAVTEHHVNTAIEAGATSVKALNRELGIGGECGACIDCAKSCLKKATNYTQTVSNNVIPIIPDQAVA